MGRRPSTLNVPACPRPGHADTRVTLGGVYGKPPRQMFKCVGANGSSHRFAGPLPRLLSESGVCAHCDNGVERHQGPVVTPEYQFHLRLAAQALIDVGAGSTYTEAAAKARVMAGKGPYQGLEANGELVAQWVDVFAPVLIAAYAETAWPETVLVDSTNFIITNSFNGQSAQAFAIIGFYGYDAGQTRGRPLGFYAAHEHLAQDYADAIDHLEALPAPHLRGPWQPPTVVLSDGESALLRGLSTHWGAGTSASHGVGGRPFGKRCEWHLRKNANKALTLDGVPGDHSVRERLNRAFQSPGDWAAFKADVAASGLVKAGGFVRRMDKQVTAQTARRAGLPPHHSIAALESSLNKVRGRIEKRAFTFRNQRRMNLLLALMRHHELRLDQHDAYTELLREAAMAAGGRITAQRTGYCTGRAYDLRP